MARFSAFGGRRGSEIEAGSTSFVGALRERIYATLTGVSVLTLLLIHVDEESTWSSVTSLVLAMGTLWLASLLSESLAHGALGNREGERGQEVGREILFTAGQSLSVMVVPLVLLLLSLTDLMSLRAALILAIASMVVTLAATAIFAVRRADVPGWARLLIVAAEVGLGLLVIFGKVVTH